MKYKTKKTPTISCPICGYEYLPEEIFVPKYVFGNPKGIVRNNGKIEYFLDRSIDLKETFSCYNCHNTFVVEGAVQFSTKPLIKEIIESEYITSRFRDTDKYNLAESEKIL